MKRWIRFTEEEALRNYLVATGRGSRTKACRIQVFVTSDVDYPIEVEFEEMECPHHASN